MLDRVFAPLATKGIEDCFLTYAPRGLRIKAQGCGGDATLGHVLIKETYPNGDQGHVSTHAGCGFGKGDIDPADHEFRG